MGESKYCRSLNGTFVFSFLAHDLSRFQGGAIAAAFTSHFPHLVDEGVALIASTGLVEVRSPVVSLPFIMILM